MAQGAAAQKHEGAVKENHRLPPDAAADMICASAFTFMPQLPPEDALIRDWVARCAARPALAAAKAYDAALLAA